MTDEPQELVWTCAGLKVTIEYDPPFLDVLASYAARDFKLLADYGVKPGQILFGDLQGNGYGSGFQSKGVGTLLVNTALLFFARVAPPSTRVFGKMSTAGDPADPAELAAKCRQIRRSFWSSFGFQIGPGESGNEPMEAVLGELVPKPTGRVFMKFPRLIPIDQFRRVGRSSDDDVPMTGDDT